ncbi:MAG TPA: hypothetical protein VHY32_02495 [Caulobacteraceae bacterium]|jgi:hypothetical protein|nr:hypothetical protein [Caulobacteraceae bacterium]
MPGASFAGLAASARKAARDGARMVVIGVGLILVASGLVLALLPGHLGLPLLVVGLILVLRNSPSARRRFIRLQRAHPRVVFPVRRLIRRDPEIFPVLWQQALRLERLIVPKDWRRAATWRRRYFRPKRS